MQKISSLLNSTRHFNTVKHMFYRVFIRRSVWVCSCGCTIPKAAAVVSGDDWCSQGFHVHCPNCGRVVAQFVDPKRVGQ